MDLLEDFWITITLLSFSILLLLIPFFGKATTNYVEVEEENITVKFLESNTLPEGDYWGSHSIVDNDIRIATGGKGVLSFMSTCSHEMYHLKSDLREEGLTTEQEHSEMPNQWLPWNWDKQCVFLLDERFGI